MATVLLPDVGEGLTEAEIVTWHVKPGDVVAVNDPLLDIETAKSVVELPSPFAGVVGELLVAEGTTVPVGTPLVAVGEDAVPEGAEESGAEEMAAEKEAAGAEASPEPEPQRQSVLVGYGPPVETTPRRRRHRRGSGAAELRRAPARALAKPPVRKRAKDLGIDLTTVPCQGDVVTRAELEAFISRASDVATEAPGRGRPAEGEREPVSSVRRATAEAMVTSAFTAPHVTEWLTIDCTRMVEFLDRLEQKVTPTVFAAKAVCLALGRHPDLHAQWDDTDDRPHLVRPPHVNLGIAAATERGLVVPVVEAAEQLSLTDLGARIGELVRTARDGKLQPEQMRGGTFTLTNVGVFGVDAGTPILNPGQTGILALGAINRRPWVDEHDQVVPRWVTTLALSFDHRVVDGAQGSRFLADVGALLADPAHALTY